MFGPVLRGSIVTMRPFSKADADSFITWLADPQVTRYMLRIFPPSPEFENDWIERMGTVDTDIMWGLEHEGRLVGTSGVHKIDWLNLHATTGTFIGDRSAWGRGVGRESMQLRARFCFTQLPLRKLESSYLEGNQASARAQAAAGYREIGRRRGSYLRDGRWLDEVLTELHREEWLEANPPAAPESGPR
jgi:RimJ/RimL family protein N-acetyltransferase